MKHKLSRITEMGNQFIFSATKRYDVRAYNLDELPVVSSLREVSVGVDDLDGPLNFEVWIDEVAQQGDDWEVIHESEFWVSNGKVYLLGIDEDEAYSVNFTDAVFRVLVPSGHSGRISEFRAEFAKMTQGFRPKATRAHQLLLEEDNSVYVGTEEALRQDCISLSSPLLTFSPEVLSLGYAFKRNIEIDIGAKHRFVLSSEDDEIIDIIQLERSANSLRLLRDEYGRTAIQAALSDEAS